MYVAVLTMPLSLLTADPRHICSLLWPSRTLSHCVSFFLSLDVSVYVFVPSVDWAAHFGGAIQGGIAAAMMLSREVESYYARWTVRTAAVMAFVVSYTWALVGAWSRVDGDEGGWE